MTQLLFLSPLLVLDAPCFPFGASAFTLPSHGVRLATGRCQNHGHIAPILARQRFNGAQFGNVLGQTLQQPHARFGAGLFASTEHDGDLNLVATFKEPLDVALLEFEIVVVNLQTETNLFQLRVGLVATRVACLLGGLILGFAIIHQLGHGRARFRSDLYQVQTGLFGEPQCVLYADDANLLTAGAN